MTSLVDANLIRIALVLGFLWMQFSNVAVSDDHKTADQYVPSITFSSSSFHFTSIHSEIVLCMLQCLDIQKSMGPDGVSARFLREVAAEIAEPLT